MVIWVPLRAWKTGRALGLDSYGFMKGSQDCIMVGVYGFSFFAGFVALHDTPDDTVFQKNQLFSFRIMGSSPLLFFSPSRFDLYSSSSFRSRSLLRYRRCSAGRFCNGICYGHP